MYQCPGTETKQFLLQKLKKQSERKPLPVKTEKEEKPRQAKTFKVELASPKQHYDLDDLITRTSCQ
jgi:hypothetical protein